MWPAMTRVWEKSHDVSFNKQVALEDAHRAVLAETAKSAHPGNVACRDHCLFKELFFVALTIFNCHPRQVFGSLLWCQLQ